MENNSVFTINLGAFKIKVFLNNISENTRYTEDLIHTHGNFEFHMVFNENTILDVEKKSISLSKNDCIIIFPKIFHRFKKDAKILSFSFSVEDNTKMTDKTFPAFENGFYIINQNTHFFNYIKKIIDNISLNDGFSEDVIKALLIMLFSDILRPLYDGNKNSYNLKSEQMSEYDSRISLIDDYFNNHYTEDIRLKELSTLLHLSEKQTNRMIKKAFGSEFREHLCKIRLKSAQKFLRETSYDIKDIADKVGYNSYNGFYLAFKKHCGITPIKYRAMEKNISK